MKTLFSIVVGAVMFIGIYLLTKAIDVKTPMSFFAIFMAGYFAGFMITLLLFMLKHNDE